MTAPAPRPARPNLSRGTAALVLSLGTCLGACAPDLPISERIATPRLLGIRNEVVGPLFPDPPEAGPRSEGLPFERMRLTPMMATPTGPLDIAGPDFDPLWLACNLGPAQGLFACLRDALPLELDDIPACPVPDLAALGGPEMMLPEPPNPCRLPDDGVADGQQEFVLPFAATLLLGGDVEVTMISRGPGSPDTATCAASLLAMASDQPNECIYAVTRVSVGPIERLLALAAMFGIDLPPELGEVPPEAEIPDGDRNPRITSFEVTLLSEDGEETELGQIERGATVQAAAGDTLLISTTTPATDLQTYPVGINNGANGTEAQMERLDGSWFRTWGELLSSGSNDLESRNEWTMVQGEQDEDELPPDGRATLYYVLRDSRLGIDWWWIDVEVAP